MATTPPKRRFSYTARDFFGFYKRHKRERKEETDITLQQYKGVVRDLWVKVLHDIIRGGCFIMPHKLGMLTVKKVTHKYKVYKIESIKAGKQIMYTKRHTNGDLFKYSWIKSSPFKNRQFYKFRFVTTPATQKELQIGQQGLKDYIYEVCYDPYKQSYTRK